MWDRRWKVVCGIVLALLAGAAWPVAQADILHLRDGSRHYGELITDDGRIVVFRVSVAGGASSVRKFASELVARVERTPETAPPGAKRAADEELLLLQPSDFEQILREAYELLDDQDRPAALKALQRLVTLAPDDILSELDVQCRAQRGRSIGELLATERLAAALADAGRSGALKLRGVTRFESAALGELLEREAEARLERLYSERTIREWATGVAIYDELQHDSRQLVADARLAAALIAGRIRHDPRLYEEPGERKRLERLRSDLSRFAAGVMSLRGYTATPADTEDDDARRRIGRGGTLLRGLPPAPASQPARMHPARGRAAPREDERGERRGHPRDSEEGAP